ncbi:hypothetical protein C0J52_02799 [Blattella germanica]|nr:hypothetical protein C0J52_02799 [Blattella germanica]
MNQGGCSSFGHSCFGGHGKRADEDVLLLPGSDAVFPPSSSGVAAQEDGGDDVMMQTAGFGGARAPSSSSSLLQSYRRSTGDLEVK